MVTKIKGLALKQRDKEVIVGKMTVLDLIKIYEVDIWKASKDRDSQGIQRPPIPAHFKKIGNKFKNQFSFSLPTSIVLSVNKNVLKESKGGHISNGSQNDIITATRNGDEIEFFIPDNQKLKVVDGQHRIKGIEYALEKKFLRGNEDFDLPFVIIVVESRYDEIKTFYEINSTSKRVSTDLALQLMNELSQEEYGKDIVISKTEILKILAINISNTLNNKKDSVWYQSISEGAHRDEIASSTSFVSSLLPVLRSKDFEDKVLKKLLDTNKNYDEIGIKLSGIIDNYWGALREQLPELFPEDNQDKKQFVIQKTPGLYILHQVFIKIIEYLLISSSPSLEMEKISKFIKTYGGEIFKDADLWKAANSDNNYPGGRLSKANSGQAFKYESDSAIDEINDNYKERIYGEIPW